MLFFFQNDMTKGTGRPTAIDNPYLTNRELLIEMILDCTERNSVIEGLPSFSPEFKERLRVELRALLRSENSGPTTS